MESIIGILEGKDTSEKVEVLLARDEESSDQLQFRLLSWGEGIGWYPQKTITLDCQEIGALRTILNRANAITKANQRHKPCSKGKVVPFPHRHKSIQQVERRALKEA